MSTKNNVSAIATLEAAPVSEAKVASETAIPTRSLQDDASKESRLAAHKEATRLATQKHLEKLARRQAELDESPVFKLFGESVKTVALERVIGQVNAESGRLKKAAFENGTLSVIEAGDGKSQLVYNTAAIRETIKAGHYGDKKLEKDLANMKKLISSLVYFGLMVRPESVSIDDEE